MNNIKITNLFLATIVFFLITQNIIAQTFYINSPNPVNLRSEKNTASSILTIIPPSADVQLVDKEGDWCKVEYKGQRGYVKSERLSERETKLILNKRTSTVLTIGGNGTAGYTGNGGQATAAELDYPFGLSIDPSGNIFVADVADNTVREINASTGIILTIAGNGTQGYSGDGGQATAAELNQVVSDFVDGSGNVYITDYGNNRIRKVNTSGVISTVAGNGGIGYGGDGGQATAATLYDPQGVTVDASGNIYFSDCGSHIIREVNTSGIINTIAGVPGTGAYNGDGIAATSADLYKPGNAVADGSGNIYISDGYNNRIRKINSSGIISTIAGNGTAGYSGDGGQATAAELSSPSRIYLDGKGNIYISDNGNNRVREMNISSGIINTIAGNSTAGYNGDGIAATSAELNSPDELGMNASGNLFIADANNQRVREITCQSNATTRTPDITTGLVAQYVFSGNANDKQKKPLKTETLILLGGLYPMHTEPFISFKRDNDTMCFYGYPLDYGKAQGSTKEDLFIDAPGPINPNLINKSFSVTYYPDSMVNPDPSDTTGYMVACLRITKMVLLPTKNEEIASTYTKGGYVFVQFKDGKIKQITEEGNNTIIGFSQKNNFVIFQKLENKSKTTLSEENPDSYDQYSVRLYDLNLNKETTLFITCLDGKGGTIPDYSNSKEDFALQCGIEIIMLTNDKSRLYYQTSGWTTCPAINYYDLKENKLVFFKAGWLKKVEDDGVVVQTTGIEEGKGRYFKTCLFNFNGGIIKELTPQTH